MAPAQAAALLVVPSLVTNLWQARPATFGPIWRRIAGMQAGACAGTLAGAWWLGAPSGVWAGVCMGVALVLYAAPRGPVIAQIQTPEAVAERPWRRRARHDRHAHALAHHPADRVETRSRTR